MSELSSVSKQKIELENLEFFTDTIDVSLGNRSRCLAKCMRCRALIEVPMYYENGAGDDAKAHHKWHLEGAH